MAAENRLVKWELIAGRCCGNSELSDGTSEREISLMNRSAHREDHHLNTPLVISKPNTKPGRPCGPFQMRDKSQMQGRAHHTVAPGLPKSAC